MPTICGNYIDLFKREIYPAKVSHENGIILKIEPTDRDYQNYILPGFVDAHVHIESSMLIPTEFARLSAPHGTIATVSDPHEIANVLGTDGVRFMINNGKETAFKFFFGAPSCVPATQFETAGAEIDAFQVEELMLMPEVKYLSEVMNYPGVINRDPELMAKIQVAQKMQKPVDGHAPGVRGKALRKYIAAGISTDHEAVEYEEGLEKIEAGLKIIIREGSAAKNFEALIPLLKDYPEAIMFCSDDKHPDDLIQGHIDQLIRRALTMGYDLFDVLRAACVNPVEHYKLPVGLLREGDPADFIEIKDLESFQVLRTWIDGQCVAENGTSSLPSVKVPEINDFKINPINLSDIQLVAKSNRVRLIKAIDGSLITEEESDSIQSVEGYAQPDSNKDILKVVVVNRYHQAPPSIAFMKGFGLKKGALASCVAHDSHNIVAVGTNDEDLLSVINTVIDHRGGIAAGAGAEIKSLALPIAGIMTQQNAFEVADAYEVLDQFARNDLGSSLKAPFMTLSFMALLVIPDLKISDKGLFSGKDFQFVDVFFS